MLNLPQRKSTFNFYESFSDLVFCTLVLFLVLILFLAVNVNQKVVAVQEVEQEVAQQNAEMKDDLVELRAEQEAAELATAEATRIREEAQRRAAEAERLRLIQEQQLAEQRDAAERERQRYEQALGVTRFTDPPAPPRLVVAYQWEELRIRVHPVPSWLAGPPADEVAPPPAVRWKAETRAKPRVRKRGTGFPKCSTSWHLSSRRMLRATAHCRTGRRRICRAARNCRSMPRDCRWCRTMLPALRSECRNWP